MIILTSVVGLLRLNWFEGCQIQTTLIFISFIVNILTLINEVRNRLGNQQKSLLKHYLSNFSWAINGRGTNFAFSRGWLVGIFQTYQFEGDFNSGILQNLNKTASAPHTQAHSYWSFHEIIIYEFLLGEMRLSIVLKWFWIWANIWVFLGKWFWFIFHTAQ